MNARRSVVVAIVLGLLAWQGRAAAVPGSTSSTGSAVSATATASASVRILGPADADVASGAVTLSRTGTLDLAGAKAGTLVASASVVDVVGAHNAVYGVTLAPEVKVTSGAQELSVTTFPAAPGGMGRLSPSGAGSVDVRVQVQVSATEASGRYAGFLPITVAFN